FLEKAPQRRYDTAAELAAELRCFLAGEPIRARPAGRVERGWRWYGRNRVVATLSALVLVLLTVTAVGGVALSVSRGKALDRALAAEEKKQKQVFELWVSGADVWRMSNRPGQRFETLQRISKAQETGNRMGGP